MLSPKHILIAAATMAVTVPAAQGQVMHAGAPVHVPVDSPWALGALAALVTVVVARAFHKRKD